MLHGTSPQRSTQKAERNREACRKWYAKTKERRRLQKNDYLVTYRRRHPIKTKLSALKSRAKRSGMPFDLDEAWLESKLRSGVSELTGTPLDLRPGFNNPRGWSIDRVDCNKGYTKRNCRIVTLHENLALSQFGEEELMRLAEALVLRRASPTKH